MNRVLDVVVGSLMDILDSAIKIVPGLIGALIIICLTRYAAKYTQQIANQIGNRALSNRSLQMLFARTSNIAIWVSGVLLACLVVFPGLGLGDIIATLGLGSVAIGFAFQDIFKNFLAGVLLLLEQPFRINDQVIINEYEGTVEGIDIRTTQIRTYRGERVILPNATVFTSAVQVRTAYNNRRTDLEVGVDYNTSLPEAAKILEHTIRRVEGVLRDPAPEIDLISFGDSSIDFMVRYWSLPRQAVVREVQTRAIMAIKQALDDANIGIPYPIRTIYHYDQEKYNDYLPASKNGDGVKKIESSERWG